MSPPMSGRSSLTGRGVPVLGQGAAGDQPGQQPQHLGSGLLGKGLPTTGRHGQIAQPKGKLAWNSYSQSAQVGSLSCSRDRDQGRGEPTCASTLDTPTSARVANCPTNRCSARNPAPSSTDPGSDSTTPNTSVASQRIVPGEPSGKSITN